MSSIGRHTTQVWNRSETFSLSDSTPAERLAAQANEVREAGYYQYVGCVHLGDAAKVIFVCSKHASNHGALCAACYELHRFTEHILVTECDSCGLPFDNGMRYAVAHSASESWWTEPSERSKRGGFYHEGPTIVFGLAVCRSCFCQLDPVTFIESISRS
jgi:hypothetical protein